LFSTPVDTPTDPHRKVSLKPAIRLIHRALLARVF
jgi:hypothetical protein